MFGDVPSRSVSPVTYGAVEDTRAEIGDLVWLLNNIVSRSCVQQRIQMAIPMWSLICFTLESLLVTCNERIDDFRRRQSYSVPEQVDVETPRPVFCRVCLSSLPTVALRSCGHVFCANCVRRLFRCPLCRRPILGTLSLFF